VTGSAAVPTSQEICAQAIAITLDLAEKYDGIGETNSFSLLFSLLAGNVAETSHAIPCKKH
jgi:hypothetical protein